MLFELRARIEEGLDAHGSWCGCSPCLIVRAVREMDQNEVVQPFIYN